MSKKVTLLFPGQGSQYVGMGKKLIPNLQHFFNRADEILGYSLSSLCFEGPEESLKLTQNTQPAILTYSTALFTGIKKLLEQEGFQIERVLGHSVGEYSALVAAEALSFTDALKAVNLRGKFMQEAVPVGLGKMVAILKCPEDMVRKACEINSTATAQVMPANFNDPQQIVISGHASACDKAVEWLNNQPTIKMKAIVLPVSAPFHSTLMQPAADKMQEVLNHINFNHLAIPYIANIDAKEYPLHTGAETLRKNLTQQICGSVLWTQSIQNLPADTLALEVGPGKILTGLVKKINPAINVIPLDQYENLEQAFAEVVLCSQRNIGI
ncbi:MAG: ACP S-malonyltransferase [Bacteriovoracaceae bacterium]|nr:ACP S-malonyltransferase [Bacteriovoracaceae bacterium]